VNRKKIIVFLITVLVFGGIAIHGDGVISVAAFTGRVLKLGSYGDDVTQLQRRLTQLGYSIPADGVFGSRTDRAVRSLQSDWGLKVDGVVGPATLNAIMGSTGGRTVPQQNTASRGVSRSDDIHLLARAIHGEARGESYEGQVAIAAVILNRVRHVSFPNTIAGVIYQPGAFTAVSDGQINLTPNEQSYRAAQDALNGWDPSGGAIYYWNPVTATSRWVWSRPIIKRIGKHVFAR
jgi:N-acetylmuramoyl-L-alanine amidase